MKSLQGFTAPAPARRRPGRPAASSPIVALADRYVRSSGRKPRGKLQISPDELRKAYAVKSAAQIASEYGVTAGAVQIRLSRWGIKKPADAPNARAKRGRPAGAKTGGKRKRGRLVISKAALRAAYGSKSAAQIAKEHGVTPSAVQQRLSRLGIKKPGASKRGGKRKR